MTTRKEDRYISRGQQEEVVPRQAPVFWGDKAAGPLTLQQVDRWEREGYLWFPDFFSRDKMSPLVGEAKRLQRKIDQGLDEVILEPEQSVVRSIFRVHRYSERLFELLTYPYLLQAVRQILGSDVYLLQSRINYKQGFRGEPFDWHADFETWHMEDGLPLPRALSISILLSENNEFNGPLMLVPGSHHLYIRCAGETPEEHFRESLQRQRIGTPSPAVLRPIIERYGLVAPKGSAGSVLLFDCNLLHASGANLSPFERNNIFAVYNSVENQLMKPFAGTKPRPTFLAEREHVVLDSM